MCNTPQEKCKIPNRRTSIKVCRSEVIPKQHHAEMSMCDANQPARQLTLCTNPFYISHKVTKTGWQSVSLHNKYQHSTTFVFDTAPHTKVSCLRSLSLTDRQKLLDSFAVWFASHGLTAYAGSATPSLVAKQALSRVSLQMQSSLVSQASQTLEAACGLEPRGIMTLALP